MSKIRVKIITPIDTYFNDEVDEATLRTIDGEVTILPSHMPYIAPLKDDQIFMKSKDTEKEFFITIHQGMAFFKNDLLVILGNSAASR